MTDGKANDQTPGMPDASEKCSPIADYGSPTAARRPRNIECGLCGMTYPIRREAESCEQGHLDADEAMDVLDEAPDEWDSMLAFANTGDSDDYSHLDPEEDA